MLIPDAPLAMLLVIVWSVSSSATKENGSVEVAKDDSLNRFLLAVFSNVALFPPTAQLTPLSVTNESPQVMVSLIVSMLVITANFLPLALLSQGRC